MSATEPNLPNRRRWLGSIVAALSLTGLGACSKGSGRPPAVPYGQALDVTQAGTFVEFEFRIDKPDRYDVLLEVFQKDPKEHPPREVWDTPNAHFKVRLQSLAKPEGEVLVEREVSKAEGGLMGKGFGSSSTESTNLMSFLRYLIKEHPLGQGSYRVRVDNLNPIPALQGRLVKASIQLRDCPK